MNCPVCDGPVWDNRETKKNPKAPDFKCKDKTCDGVIWPPKDKKPAVAQKATGPKWTWMTLAKMYERSLLTAEMRVIACAERLGTKATVADVLQATATIFIQASKEGVAEPVVKLPPKPKEPEPVEEEAFDA